jgi:hypothetical protein
MAHTYVIQKQEFQPPGTTGPTAANPNPLMRVTATVDGTQVFLNTTFSVINQPTAILYQNTMTPLLLTEWQALQAPVTQTPPLLTWTV